MKEEEINILVAEDNDVSRSLIAGIVRTQGYNVVEARDGSEAIKKFREHKIHLAIIDQVMEPMGGIHFAQHMVVNNHKIPIMLITAHDVSDLLFEANKYGISRVLQKPVSPENIICSINRMLAQSNLRKKSVASRTHNTKFSHEDLMRRAIGIAAKNYKSGKGRPFGAVIANKDGTILGEGSNGIASRCDPTAHAEVMAIRQATERTGSSDLGEYVLYCNNEPTKIGKALIASVGIKEVYFAMSNEEMDDFLGEQKPESQPEYIRLCKEEAFEMMQNFSALKK